MKKLTKDALLSALVFPGVWHIYLKKYAHGSLMAGTAFAALCYLAAKEIARALLIVGKILSGEIQTDIATVTRLVSKPPAGTEALLINIATTLFILSWIFVT